MKIKPNMLCQVIMDPLSDQEDREHLHEIGTIVETVEFVGDYTECTWDCTIRNAWRCQSPRFEGYAYIRENLLRPISGVPLPEEDLLELEQTL